MINEMRMQEIAEVLASRIAEHDQDFAREVLIDELDMEDEELDYFGISNGYVVMHGYVVMQITLLFTVLAHNSVQQHFLDAKIKKSEFHVDAFSEQFQNLENK